MNKTIFFNHVRSSLFNGLLSQLQVDGINLILDEWCKRDLKDDRWLAYILATVYHETAATMQPIEEYGKGRNKEYGKPDSNGCIYYGRGFVQLTWKRNYKLFDERYNIGLTNNPDLALQPNIAVKILFDGMINGLFTGKGLGNYFNAIDNWIEARAIVNGSDKAKLIASYAHNFYYAISQASIKTADQDIPTIINESVENKDTIINNTITTPPVLQPINTNWLSGKKTHIGMTISAVIGIAAMFGYIPGMTAAQGADMLQTAFGISGFRSAIPTLIKLAINYYVERKNLL